MIFGIYVLGGRGMNKKNTKIRVYETKNEDNMLIKKEDIAWGGAEKSENTICINDKKTYQTIDGFGASFTDASAYLVHEVLGEAERKIVMDKLFSDEKGIGLSFVRQPMGASDFACSIYSYQDTPNNEDDFELNYFTIEHDKKYILPLLKEMMTINPKVRLMATPWSAPAWMKTTNHMIGGTLREDCYEVFAEYFVKFIRAYEAEGVPMYAITPQNEPMFVPHHYPGMKFEAKQEAMFIKNHLGPRFKAEKIDTKILCYDHNWDIPEYPLEVLNEAGEYVNGVAWHVYAADPSAQSLVFNQFKDKEVYYTEASGGQWIAPFDNAFSSMMRTNIGTLRNHSKTIVLWNIALDENNGPTVPGFGQSTCRGLLKINQQTKEVTYNLDYYALAHFSQFVKQGAKRIESNEIEGITNVAFKNLDGTIVLVISSNVEDGREIKVAYNNKYISYKLAGKAAVTLVWE